MRRGIAGERSNATHEQEGSPAQGTTSEMLDFRNYKEERSMRFRRGKRYASYWLNGLNLGEMSLIFNGLPIESFDGEIGESRRSRARD